MEQEKKKSKTMKIVIAVITVVFIIVVIAFASTQMQKEAKIRELEKEVEQAKQQLNEALNSMTPFSNNENQTTNGENEEEQNSNNQEGNSQTANEVDIAKLEKEQKLTCKSAKIAVQSTEYKSLYPDMLTAKVTNNSKETVKSYKIVFLAYDNNYLPVKIKGKYSSSGEYSRVCLDDEANLVAGATTKDDSGWELDSNHGITYVIACVQEAEFFNGETWENPYIQYWLEKYEGKILPENSRKGLTAYKNK